VAVPAGGALAQSDEPAVASEELVSVTLGGDAIPEDLAGVLFFRKVYPTDAEISYSGGFVPPNTFARYVESGALGIRPVSPTSVVRAGSSWEDAEVVGVGDETVVHAGDAFVMHDVPWDEFGPQALGEMWTPGDDARVVGFAIRETSRCCSMSHAGMQSPWYGTLVEGVDALRGNPVTLHIDRWQVPVGEILPPTAGDVPTVRFLDAGELRASSEALDEETEPLTFEFRAGRSLQLPLSVDVESLVFESTGTDPAVVYELRVEPA
jgi:hypothetical protein